MSVDLSSTDGDERFKFAPGFLSDSPPDMQHPPLQYDNSLSSLTPSLPSTSDDSSPHKIMSSAPTPHRHVRHSSLNLFRRLPIDLSSFIRPRYQSIHPQPSQSRSPKPALLDSAITRLCQPELELPPMDVTTSRTSGRERFTQKLERKFTIPLKSQNRSVESVDSVPALPDSPSEHGRASAVDRPDIPRPPLTSDASKPTTRVRSRPLSSTTSATNTTILPPTPTQSRLPQSLELDHNNPPLIHSQGDVSSQPSTSNNPSNIRKGLRDFFGSHPPPPNGSDIIHGFGSPGTSSEALPLPRFFAVPDLVSSARDLTLRESPLPSESTQTKNKSRASGFSGLEFFRRQKIFSNPQKPNGTNLFTSSSVSQQPPESGTPDLYPCLSAPATIPPVTPSRHELPLQVPEIANERALDPKPSEILFSNTPAVRSSSSVPRTAHASVSPSRIPKIFHTHPIPAGSPVQHGRRKVSYDLNDRHRGTGVEFAKDTDKERGRRGIREQRTKSPQPVGVIDRKGKAREGDRPERVVIAITQNRERPSTADADNSTHAHKSSSRRMQRMTNTTTTKNGRAKHGSFDFEQPIWNQSRTDVPYVGYNWSKDSVHSTVNGKQGTRSHNQNARGPKNSHLNQPPSASSNSTSNTKSSQAAPPPASQGQSNWRETGRRAKTAAPIGLSHGRFPFEPIVPAASKSEGADPSATTAGDPLIGEDEITQHRHGRRGHSLDLRLGLTWAPTKLKEEALMPFAKSILRANSSRKANQTNLRTLDVTEAFRTVLSEDGFTKFKKYVHRFDAHGIPFDGPSGIVTRVEKLLDSVPSLDLDGKRELMDRFVRIILQNT